MPFYLYGSTQDSEYHIDHTLAAAPNTQFTAGEVTIPADVQRVLPTFSETSPYINIIVDLPERAMQPFPSNKDIANDTDFFFRPNKVLPFKFTAADGTSAKGSLTLTKNVFVDTDMLNEDPVPKKGGCYAREYSLRAHAYAVALLGAHVHTGHTTRLPAAVHTTLPMEGHTTLPMDVHATHRDVHAAHLDTVAQGREWQDIIVCIWSLTWA
jgi:hypothetical protein